MENKELLKRIDELLSQQHVITLSTADSSGPWAAPVYYAQDGYELYFVTNPTSRHGKAIESGSELAGAVHASSSDWQEIKGLQMTGIAAMLPEGPDLEKARKRYFERYPFTEVFFRQQELLEPEIREKAASVRFYGFRPSRIVLVDNSVRFGFHGELRLD
jgi:uncharacterized protein YhbP (UPF0306 family)